jgi:hypothetical protein
VALLALGTVQCSDGPIVAPENATLIVALAPSTIGADGDTSRVSVYLSEPDGVYVDDETRVVLSVSGAWMCALPSAGELRSARSTDPAPCSAQAAVQWSPIVELRTHGGVASALLRSGPTSGALSVTAKSGTVSQSTNVTVSALVAPSTGKGTIQLAQESLAAGKSMTVDAFLTTQDGAPVPDNTRVVFTSSDTAALALSRTVALTSAGLARTTATARDSDKLPQTVTVAMASGPLNAKATVEVVKP